MLTVDVKQSSSGVVVKRWRYVMRDGDERQRLALELLELLSQLRHLPRPVMTTAQTHVWCKAAYCAGALAAFQRSG